MRTDEFVLLNRYYRCKTNSETILSCNHYPCNGVNKLIKLYHELGAYLILSSRMTLSQWSVT